MEQYNKTMDTNKRDMKLIKIDLNSIKKNPDAGQTQTNVTIGWSSSVEVIGEIPSFLKENEDYFCQSYKDINYLEILRPQAFNLIFEKMFEEEFKAKFRNLSQKRNNQSIYHSPIPSHSYCYINEEIECTNCKNKIKLFDIKEEEEEDNLVRKCPLCGFSSFEEFEFEKFNKNLMVK